MTLLSAICLVIGVLCYGFAGAKLHTGANSERGALRSPAWWLGTGLQGAGFVAMLLSRINLPLLLVQACSSAGLAVSALIQHLTRVRRLSGLDAIAIVAVVLGLGALAMTTLPGPATPPTPMLLILLTVTCLLAGPATLLRLPGIGYGVLSGVGFSVGAIAARLALGDHDHPIWLFWQLPLMSWACLVLTGVGIVIGQAALTRGLRGRDAAPVLGAMYLVETLLPAIVGIALMNELPRPGMAPLAIAGVVVAALGIAQLLRTEK